MSTGNNPLLPKLSPITIKERVSLVYVEKGNLDVLDGAFVVVDVNGVRTHIPVGGVSCLMFEPGTRISHAAVALAARVGCLICWIGEAPACVCIRRASRAERGQTDFYIRHGWRWMKRHA